MTRVMTARYEMLQKVSLFGMSHADLLPAGSTGADAFAAVTAAIQEMDTQGVNQLSLRADRGKTLAYHRGRLRQRMRAVVRTWRGLPTAPAGTRPHVRMPQRVSDATLLNAARALVRDAETQHHQLSRFHLPPTWLADLREAVDAFQAARVDRGATRAQVKAAFAAQRAALACGMDAVHTLDIVIANVLDTEAATYRRWLWSRRIPPVRRRRPRQVDAA